MKWLQSDGETGTGSGENGGSRGGLSGFSQNPSEERLARGGDIVSLSPSGMSARQRAELTKEEKAAIEAGLQDVFFGYDQWVLSDAGMEALNLDAQWLKDHPGAVMKVEGHCDGTGHGRLQHRVGGEASQGCAQLSDRVRCSTKAGGDCVVRQGAPVLHGPC